MIGLAHFKASSSAPLHVVGKANVVVVVMVTVVVGVHGTVLGDASMQESHSTGHDKRTAAIKHTSRKRLLHASGSTSPLQFARVVVVTLVVVDVAVVVVDVTLVVVLVVRVVTVVV